SWRSTRLSYALLKVDEKCGHKKSGSGAGRSLTRAQPTPPSGCRGFESGHANKAKASHLNRREAFA
ncbi:MAG: hypothetical protein IKZ10_05430, partial [Akkermansia sp.]|nr:hypothetical protein [Akkermansia sp.]